MVSGERVSVGHGPDQFIVVYFPQSHQDFCVLVDPWCETLSRKEVESCSQAYVTSAGKRWRDYCARSGKRYVDTVGPRLGEYPWTP